MKNYLTDEQKKSIKNAIKSLYQLIVLVEEGSLCCQVVDYNGELESLKIEHVKLYNDLFHTLYKNTHPEDRERLLNLENIENINEMLSKQLYTSVDCRIRHSDFKYYWSRIIICNSSAEDLFEGNEYLLLIQDIHAEKQASLAEYDELIRTIGTLKKEYDDLFLENMTDAQTGCYNRKGLKYFETIVLKESLSNDKYLFVCVLDLNGLKYLNDTYGHGAGDVALSAVSDALRKSAPEGAYAFRTGGDEFLVIAALDPNIFNPDDFKQMLDAELASYNKSHSNPFEVSASYGYVFMQVKEWIDSLDEYIEDADKKMYQMKELTDPYKR